MITQRVWKSWFLVLCAILSGLAFGKEDTIRIGMLPWIGWTPLHLAKELNYWQERGLKVDVISFESSYAMNAAFLNDEVDVTMELIGTAVGWYLDGVELRILAETDWSNGGDKIIIKKGDRLKNLKGETIGTYLDTPAITYFLDIYLRSQSLALADFRLVRMPPEDLLQNFIDGRIRFMVNYDPHTLKAVQEGKGHILVNSAKFPGCMPQGMLVKKVTLDRIPEEKWVTFFEGYLQAVSWMKDPANWDALVQAINNLTFSRGGPFDDKQIRGMLATTLVHDVKYLKTRNQPEGGLARFLEDMHQFLKQNNELERSFTPKDLIETSPLLKAIGK